MLRLAVGVNALALLLLAVEVGAVAATEDGVAARVRTSTGATGARARVSSFPFVIGLLTDGIVDRLTVTASDVPAGALTLASVTVDARRLRIDRHELVSHRRVRVMAARRADVTVEINARELSDALGYPVTSSRAGALEVTVNGTVLPLSVRIEQEHTLAVSAAGTLLAAFDLATSPVVPSCRMAVDSTTGLIALGCRVEPVPLSLIDAISASLQG